MDTRKLLGLLQDCAENGNNIFEALDVNIISSVPYCKNWEVKTLTAELLANNCNNGEGEKVLLQLAKDKDYLVRTNAVDSLSSYETPQSLAACIEAMEDENAIVRSYAVFGVAVIGKRLKINTTVLLQQAREKEKDPQVLVALGEARYIAGVKEGLQEMMDLYSVGDYRLKCSILNGLQEILCAENCQKIENFAQSIRKSGEYRAVLENIESLLEQCQSLRE